MLEEKIARTAPRLDAEPQPKPTPTPRAPRALPCEAEAPPPRQTQPQQPTDAATLLASLPTAEEIAAKVRRQPIGAVLADICRDLGLYPAHPLWRELRLVINQYGGNRMRMSMEQFNRVFPTATPSPASKPNARPRAHRPQLTRPPPV